MKNNHLQGPSALALLFSLVFFSVTAIASPVIGYNGSVTEKGSKIEFKGWTCQAGVPQSLKVHIYVGGPAGKGGTFIGSGTANVSHEQGVTDKCGNTVPHRYVINIDESKLVAHKGKGVYAHGISVVQGYGNSALTNGGKYTIPSFTRELKLSQITKTGSDTVIEDDMVVDMDVDHTTRVLKINGTLNCPISGNRLIRAKAITVCGTLQCGTASSRVQGKITFRLRGEYQLEMVMDHGGMIMNHDMGIKAFAVLGGGKVFMYGDDGKSTWAYLTKTATAGSTRIKVNKEVSWQPGDLLAIAPTDFDFNQAEHAVIRTRISAQEFELETALKHEHYGKNKKYERGNLALTLRSRAEVGNLSRHIVIETEEDVTQSSLGELRWIGAHMMVMNGGYAEIDAVEFKEMGQMGLMARYPFHWHIVGDAPGQFIKNSSVHHSFQRCITVHGTNQTTVENNVCYDHRGHGIFLEDGNEINNVIKKNLVIKSRKPELDRVLLESDHTKRNLTAEELAAGVPRSNTVGFQSRRFVGPSGFWIANPKNTVSGNVSAGSEGTGFWMSFEDRELCNPSTCSHPSKENTKAFNSNTARSCLVGITWDGARGTKNAGNPLNDNDMEIESVTYSPSKIPTFKNNQAMKCRDAGFYTRSSTMNFENTLSADNSWHHFHAFNIRLINSILVGQGPNSTTSTTEVFASKGNKGMILYDGPFELDNVFFVDYSSQKETVSDTDTRDITAYPMHMIFGAAKYTNRVKDLSFSPEPYARVDMTGGGNGDDIFVSNHIMDLDGSLSGKDAMVVPNVPFNRISGCSTESNWSAMSCPIGSYRIGYLRINNMDTSGGPTKQYPQFDRPHFFFNTIRSDGVEVHSKAPENILHNKVALLTTGVYDYTVDFLGQAGHLRQFTWFTEHNEPSPVFKVIGMSDTCDVDGASKKTSLSAVSSSTTTAYYRSGKTLYVKIYPNTDVDKHTGTIRYRNGVYKMSCY